MIMKKTIISLILFTLITFEVSAQGSAVDLGLSVKWASCNVGASSPEQYGSYFSWGEINTKSKYSDNNSLTIGKKFGDIKADPLYDAATVNCGSSWRLPTLKEFEELKERCTWQWTTQGGKKGYKITGPNGNSIFLPASGYRNNASLYEIKEAKGRYWTSTPDENYNNSSYAMFFSNNDYHTYKNLRYDGFTIRPVIATNHDIKAIKWTVETEQLNKKEFNIILKADIKDGWYLFAHNNPNGISLPLHFDFSDNQGIELIGNIVEEEPIVKYNKTLKVNEHFFEKQAVFTQKVKATSKYVNVTVYVNGNVIKDQCIPFSQKLDTRIDNRFKILGFTIDELIEISLPLLLICTIIIHMIYELLFKGAPKKLNINEIRQARSNAGLSSMSYIEANTLLNKISAIYNSWTQYVDENGNDMCIITKHSQAKKTRLLLEEIAASLPDNSDVIREYNELREYYITSTKRTYNASTPYIVISAIISVVFSLIAQEYSMLGFVAVSIILYIMASMTPTYMNDRRVLSGNNRRAGFMSGLIAGIFGTLATAKTVTTITKWSDGSTTRDTDNSQVWGALIFTIIMLFLIAMFMYVVAFINYLRNYILHI